jgi:hypothetical protein
VVLAESEARRRAMNPVHLHIYTLPKDQMHCSSEPSSLIDSYSKCAEDIQNIGAENDSLL